MKSMNCLKKLLVLSSLVLNLTVRADGTLPLPRALLEDGTLPLALSGQASGGTTPSPIEATLGVSMKLNTPDLGSAVDPNLKSCAAGESFYPAGGSVDMVNSRQEEINYAIKGMCAPSNASSNHRQILATSPQHLARFDGTFDTEARTFNGALKLSARQLTPAAAVHYELRLNVN